MKLKELFVSKKGEEVPLWKAAFSMLLTCVLVVLFFWVSLIRIDYAADFSFLPDFRQRIWSGFWMTVLISVASMLLSLALGILSAAGRSCRILVLRYLCSLYVTFIRGTPLIMQIYLFYYIVGTAWGIENRFAAGVLYLKERIFRKLFGEACCPWMNHSWKRRVPLALQKSRPCGM